MAAGLWCLTGAAATENVVKPNVVINVADDLGWKEVSFCGADIPPP